MPSVPEHPVQYRNYQICNAPHRNYYLVYCCTGFQTDPEIAIKTTLTFPLWVFQTVVTQLMRHSRERSHMQVCIWAWSLFRTKGVWYINNGRGFGCGLLKWVWFHPVPKISFMNLATMNYAGWEGAMLAGPQQGLWIKQWAAELAVYKAHSGGWAGLISYSRDSSAECACSHSESRHLYMRYQPASLAGVQFKSHD